mmetsp:Transcript_22933/g.79647  ORF Transcript_22933/g.79647 Transcript_22933/m.79647 type:complete len:347 (+) Transcript_22933:310-1350(+)
MRGGPRGGEELFAHLRERALPPTHGDGERPRVQVVLEHDTWFLGRPRASLARWRSRFFARRRTALRRHADEVEQVVKVVFRAAVRVRRKGARRALVVVLDDRPHHVSRGQSVLLCHPSRPALERRRVDGNVPVVAQEMAQHDERRRRDERRSDRGAVCDRTVEHQLARRRHVRLLDGLARKQRDAVDAVEDGRDGGPCLLVDAGDDRRIDEALRLAIHSLEVLETWTSRRPDASTPKVAFLSGNAPTESAATREKVPRAPCSNFATKTPSMPEMSCEEHVERIITASRMHAMGCHELSRRRTISRRPALFVASSGGGMPLACPSSPTIAHHCTRTKSPPSPAVRSG